MHVNRKCTYSMAGRVAIAALVWASLSVPAALEATAQESTPMVAPDAATPMMAAQEATPMAAAQQATPMAAAQDATPMATPTTAHDVPLIDAAGDAVGLATFSETADGVTVRLLIEGLTPGEHGWHLHEFGVCESGDTEPFSSAGEHWNPTSQPHGGPDDDEHHAGDFGNLVATADGLAEIEIMTTDFTFEAGPTSVFDDDGTAIVIHEGVDDLVAQPDGNSGPRYACGVVAEPTDMAATPNASEAIPSTMATPMAMATPMTMMTPEGMAQGMATPEDMTSPEGTDATPMP